MRGTDGRYYDRVFDLNGDGRLDAGEICFMDEMIFGHGDASSDSSDELDEDDLEDMDEDERKEYMEENGLDPDDYDGDWD